MKESLTAVLIACLVMFSGLKQEGFSQWLSRNAKMESIPVYSFVADPGMPEQVWPIELSQELETELNSTLANSPLPELNVTVVEDKIQLQDVKLPEIASVPHKML